MFVWAPKRAERERDPRCPFCPGNEELTPPEIERVGEPWQVRVFPNKFPILPGHEVIVESPKHGPDLEDLSEEELVPALETWGRRIVYHYSKGAHWVAFFHNRGKAAGASREHVHSQLVPMKFAPPSPPLLPKFSEGLIFYEGNDFVGFASPLPRLPGESWLVPKSGKPFPDGSLAPALKRALSAVVAEFGPAYNLVLVAHPELPRFGLNIIPRRAQPAGFELGTGLWVVSLSPLEAARALAERLTP